MKRLILLILISIFFLSGKASLYRTYQTEDGLSHNSVWAVMQDSRGFMWFGTNDGLNRFDGLNFKTYRCEPSDTLSIGSNFIHCLLETPAGKILVGTKEGLYCYDPSTETFRHISLDGSSFGEDKTSIHSLVPDSKGNIWVGCYGQGIYSLTPELNRSKHFAGPQMPSLFVTDMALDASDNLWVGSANAGLFKVDPTGGKVTKTIINTENIQSVCRQNSNNTLWVGTTSNGLYHYDPRKNQYTSATLDGATTRVRDIKAITPYNAGEMILGSEYGLLKLDNTREQLTAFDNNQSFGNMPDNSIFSIAVDNEGGIWLGTYYYGVSYRSPKINAFSFYPVNKENNGASHYNIIRHFNNLADGNILLTSRNQGLSVFNPSTGSINPTGISGAGAGDISAVMILGNEAWIGHSDKGITVVAYPSGGISRTYSTANGLPSNTVNTMLSASDGRIYVGTVRGGAVLNGNAFSAFPALKDASVTKIIEDFNGNIWFATHFHGLYKLTPDRKLYNYKNRKGDVSSLPGNNINEIFLDSKGKIWVGTESEGLAVLNPSTGKVEKRFSESTGLPSNIIYAVEEDDGGNMWITTGGGLIKINGEDLSIQNFRYLENLLKIHYTHNSSLNAGPEKNLFFGGSGGFLTFNPSEISINTVVPTVFITSFSIDGKPKVPAYEMKSIVMESSQTTLEIDLACLSYLSPEQNVVAYRLEGVDEDWRYLTGRERHLEYMNLPWGSHRLELKGANNDGIWSEPVTMDIKVNRPLLMSNGMLVVYLLILILVGYLVKQRVSAMQRRRMVKFSHAKEKELYEAKIGFFTNIAHEIRTPLSLISAPLESILASNDGNEKTRRNLEVMRSNVQRLLELINQLLDFRKVEAQLMCLNFRRCNVSEIILDICSRYEEFANLHLIKLDTKGVEKDIECTLDADAFEKIVGNLMSNAMKYANKHIKVSMHIDEANGKLHLEVVDDGPGIKEKDREHIFESFYRVDDHGKHPGTGLGLPLARSLAEMHSGTLTVESQYGHGSKFILEIPTSLEPGKEMSVEEAEAVTHDTEILFEREETRNEKATVLIVEDNEQLREFIAENLQEIHHVKTASNGSEAIKTLEESVVDLIVSDIMMPDMDGIELCRAVRNNHEYSHIPVILLSAKTDVETKVEGLNIGADAYIEKPFSMQQLKAQIKSIFDSRERLQESLIQSPLDYYARHKTEEGKESEKADFIRRLNEMILENLTNPEFSIDGLAQEFCMSRSSFHKRIKGITGETPNDYIRIVRLSKSAELLASGKYQIVEVCYMVGFNTPSYFSKCFSRHFGKLPKEYINELNNNNNNNKTHNEL